MGEMGVMGVGEGLVGVYRWVSGQIQGVIADSIPDTADLKWGMTFLVLLLPGRRRHKQYMDMKGTN